MTLVAQAVQTTEVPVLDGLLDEAKEWHVALELGVPHPVSEGPVPAQGKVTGLARLWVNGDWG
jgi:hypothetical protein